MKQKIFTTKEGLLYDPFSRKFIDDKYYIVDTDNHYWSRALRDGDIVIYEEQLIMATLRTYDQVVPQKPSKSDKS